MCRTEAVRQQRRADTPLPGLHSLELHSRELRVLARLRAGILAHLKLHSRERPAALQRSGILARPKLRSPERPAALHRAGNVDGPSHRSNADGKCAPNGYGGEERDAGAADAQAHAVSVWPEFSLPSLVSRAVRAPPGVRYFQPFGGRLPARL